MGEELSRGWLAKPPSEITIRCCTPVSNSGRLSAPALKTVTGRKMSIRNHIEKPAYGLPELLQLQPLGRSSIYQEIKSGRLRILTWKMGTQSSRTFCTLGTP